MNSTTHVTVGGLTGGLIIAYCISNRIPHLEFSGYELYPAVITAASAIGGLAPDVDMARSKAGAFFRSLVRVVLGFSALFALLITFVPQTGISIIDKMLFMGYAADTKLPIILAGFCVALLIVVERSNHRGFTHTPIALLMIAAPLVYILITNTVFSGINIVLSAQIGFVLGWLSHMVIDTFNYPGTPWLWPFVRNHFNIMRVDSGTSQETAFLAACAVLFIAGYGVIIF